jgi:hypothetical protein
LIWSDSIFKPYSNHITNIIDANNGLCIIHIGQFAKDYKLMFGELPSKMFSQT